MGIICVEEGLAMHRVSRLQAQGVGFRVKVKGVALAVQGAGLGLEL